MRPFESRVHTALAKLRKCKHTQPISHFMLTTKCCVEKLGIIINGYGICFTASARMLETISVESCTSNLAGTQGTSI